MMKSTRFGARAPQRRLAQALALAVSLLLLTVVGFTLLAPRNDDPAGDAPPGMRPVPVLLQGSSLSEWAAAYHACRDGTQRRVLADDCSLATWYREGDVFAERTVEPFSCGGILF